MVLFIRNNTCLLISNGNKLAMLISLQTHLGYFMLFMVDIKMTNSQVFLSRYDSSNTYDWFSNT